MMISTKKEKGAPPLAATGLRLRARAARHGRRALPDRSDDAPRWDAGQLVRAAELGGECIAIRTRRTANYPVLLVACLASGGPPGAIVGHRTLDGEDAARFVDDDQEERSPRFIRQCGCLARVQTMSCRRYQSSGRAGGERNAAQRRETRGTRTLPGPPPACLVQRRVTA